MILQSLKIYFIEIWFCWT